LFPDIASILQKQVNAEEIIYTENPITDSIAIVVKNFRFYLKTKSVIDTSIQKDQLLKDLEYQKGFLLSVEKKLSNERFVQNAKPEIVEVERKKKADAEAKIKAIEESLASL
jgi:valyl-tRNA synthetase